MRDITRARLSAAAKSRRASAKDLREAQARIKEIDAELRQIELQPETKQGEEREARYQRVLRLRQMRSEFEARYPAPEQQQPNSIMLALVMTVGSFLVCAFCAGGFYFAFNALNYNPGPTATAATFWSDAQSQTYSDIYLNLLSTNLRLQFVQAQFLQDARQADTDYGPITNAVLTGTSGDLKTNATLTYDVTRQKTGKKPVQYKVTLALVSTNNSWSVSDLGASIYPTEAGVAPVNAPAPTPTKSKGP